MNQKSLFILGRQPAIGRAELESLYGSNHLQPMHDHAMLGDLDASAVDFLRLGSTVKLGAVLATLPSTTWHDIQKALTELALAAAGGIAEGKIQIGLSAYGIRTNARQLTGAGLAIKKVLRNQNYSVRLTPNQELELSSAQVLHNHLTGERGIELLIVRHENNTIIARTTDVQNINDYAARDQGRPKRDAFVGMLPPKLAQTIVNLGTGPLKPSPNQIVLDPFCGTGVVLQEALLMGYGAYGSDLEPRMIDYTRTNLTWLAETRGTPEEITLEVGDATTHRWKYPFSVVAGETYLGRPLSGWPTPEKMHDIIGTCNVILEKFLRNLRDQLPADTRLCLAMPAWCNPNGRIHHLSLLDRLDDLGYNRVSFEYAEASQLVYHRPDQLVGRELVVITRK